MNQFKHELGATAEDRITGFSGIITARSEYLTGCNTYALQPKVDDRGVIPDPKWFDEPSLRIWEKIPVVELDFDEEVGGPRSTYAPLK